MKLSTSAITDEGGGSWIKTQSPEAQNSPVIYIKLKHICRILYDKTSLEQFVASVKISKDSKITQL